MTLVLSLYDTLSQIHAWDKAADLKEVLRTMDDLVRSGKVRYIGASNVTGWQMQKIMDYCNFMGLNKWVSLQVSKCYDPVTARAF